MRGFFDTWWSLIPLFELLVPVALLACRLPRRPHAALRGVLVLCGLLAAAVGPLATGTVRGLGPLETFVVFSVLLAIFVAAVLFVCDVRPWTALFCATAGYTLQNIASGFVLLLQMLVTGHANELPGWPVDVLISLGVPATVYLIGYWAFVHRVTVRGLIDVENRLMLSMFAVVVIAVIGLDVLIKTLALVGIPFRYLVLLRLVHPIICVFVLFAEYELLVAKRASDERAETERLLAERERQYRLSRENIEAINIKCHDIRHQIRQLADGGAAVDGAVLADIAREVDVYDSSVETGNEALDTILTEKGLTCSGEGIVLTVVADGAALGFMAPADIYALFGNALDNAIDAARAVADPERRAISISVRRRGNMAAVSVENCCAAEPRFSAEGLPLTTKTDTANHGFGVRSMRAIARRYGGSLHAGAQDGVFYLNVLLADPRA
ncbi:ATP-binding protein [Thermophilibacter sp.]